MPGYEVRRLEEDFKKNDVNKDNKLSFEEFENVFFKNFIYLIQLYILKFNLILISFILNLKLINKLK